MEVCLVWKSLRAPGNPTNSDDTLICAKVPNRSKISRKTLWYNEGREETVNLTEWLAVNQKILPEHVLRRLDRPEYIKPVVSRIDRLDRQTINTRNEASEFCKRTMWRKARQKKQLTSSGKQCGQ